MQNYAPSFEPEQWSQEDLYYLTPFASNPNGMVSTLHNLPPEIVGALCSRASRARGYLLRVFLDEYVYPIIQGDDKRLAKELKSVVEFYHKHGFKNILNNQRAQGFYAKWLSQYGDDSIAQMTGTHLIFWGISQVAMKYLEDQRIGLEPIEKSTRYVNFGEKIGGNYLYYTPEPDLKHLDLLKEYRATLDNLFCTYNILLPQLIEWLKNHYEEKESVLEKKAFDALRGLLPMATVGQVAFRGNAQAFEYMLNRTRRHELGEFRWIAETAKQELDYDIPSLLLRVTEEKANEYQNYLSSVPNALESTLSKNLQKTLSQSEETSTPIVTLTDIDPLAEEKIITAILYSLPRTHASWNTILQQVKTLKSKERDAILESFFRRRKERWYKIGRAPENIYMRFDIVMDIGAYRDIHRHRMLTQDRQYFSIWHGYHTSQEIRDAGLDIKYRKALDSVRPLFKKIERKNPALAQYVVPLAYRIRFYQFQNVTSLFWETELRTGPQGHPDYRFIEQEKYRLFVKAVPRIAKFMKVDLNQYSFARRGEEARIKQKEERLIQQLPKG